MSTPTIGRPDRLREIADLIEKSRTNASDRLHRFGRPVEFSMSEALCDSAACVAGFAYLAFEHQPELLGPQVSPASRSAAIEPRRPNPAVSHQVLARAQQRLVELQASAERLRGL